jgi:bacteriophage N4 adsorption protein A
MILTRMFIFKLKLFLTALIVMFSMMVFSSHAADALTSQNKQAYYLDKVIIERSERFLEPVVRKFRSFPHLDRAYRLMEESRYAESRIEFRNSLKSILTTLKQEYHMSSCYMESKIIVR